MLNELGHVAGVGISHRWGEGSRLGGDPAPAEPSPKRAGKRKAADVADAAAARRAAMAEAAEKRFARIL